MVEVCTIFIICLEVYESIHLDRRINELEKEIKRVQMGIALLEEMEDENGKTEPMPKYRGFYMRYCGCCGAEMDEVTE